MAEEKIRISKPVTKICKSPKFRKVRPTLKGFKNFNK